MCISVDIRPHDDVCVGAPMRLQLCNMICCTCLHQIALAYVANNPMQRANACFEALEMRLDDGRCGAPLLLQNVHAVCPYLHGQVRHSTAAHISCGQGARTECERHAKSMGGDGGEYAADGNGKGGVGESAGGAARRRPQPSTDSTR